MGLEPQTQVRRAAAWPRETVHYLLGHLALPRLNGRLLLACPLLLMMMMMMVKSLSGTFSLLSYVKTYKDIKG